MSRIGRMPIPVPPGVEVRIDGQRVEVQGPKGKLVRVLRPEVRAVLADGQLRIEPTEDSLEARAQWGLHRTLVANMVEGVFRGYEKQLELSGVGYRAAKQGNRVVLTVGFSHPVEIEPPEGIQFDVPNPTNVVVRGFDRELVGQVAARIRSVRPPEPYKGKGIHYVGERIRRKVGKTGKK
ncbi:MAG: 50S ribosomal protein L6 [Firmicutes bacterium]|nr:50S ribosomal protein L6 [Alicyclobacillaceae bacterium]MCL6497978.1 50S ribosomal protein L6 [Bacillota bacterium]